MTPSTAWAGRTHAAGRFTSARITQDIEMKKTVYQAIMDSFSRQGIQPTLISVAYLDAPFYK